MIDIKQLSTIDPQKWHQAYAESVMQEAAAQELGLTQIIAQLVTKNNEVETLMGQRSDEAAQKADVQFSADRKAVDEAMRDFTQMLNALALVDDDPNRFDQLIDGLTQTQADYQQRYEEHRRSNRRVKGRSSECHPSLLEDGRVVTELGKAKVTSTLVGNHTYAVTSGCTWATIAQRNPKALALDPTPSAPGVEPVVTARRIISLDPKAQKAGGLCVALKGTPVSPADEVDAAKEYQLVSYGE